MAEIIKISGLILKASDYGESDKILTVLCAEKGLITVWAKGVRSLKSANRPLCHPLLYGEFALYNKGEALWLKEGVSNADYYDISLGLEGLALVSYFADVVSYVCLENQDNREILSFLLNTLEINRRGKYAAAHIKAVFELKIACLLGFAPLLRCDKCDCKADVLYVNFARGGEFLCEKCQNGGISGAVKLTNPVIKAIAHVTEGQTGRIYAFSLQKEDEDIFNYICENYLMCVTEHKYHTLDYLKELLSCQI